MSATGRVSQAAHKTASEYCDGADLPLAGYLAAMGAYCAFATALTGIAAASGRKPASSGLSPLDTLTLAAATHKISLLLTKDPVTSPLRAPFTSYRGTAGPAEVSEEPRGHGARKAVGEMVTNPYCASLWVATGLTAGLVFAPRLTRLVTGGFAALAGADMLQLAHSRRTG